MRKDGYSDPHLHVHLYVPNVSWDSAEKKFKALQMGRIHEMADDLEKIATKLFAGKLEAIGLVLEPTEHAFEIAGFYRELIEKFSRRTLTIEKTAERLGITDPAEKAKLAALTRENKIKDVNFSDFEQIWWGSLLPDEEKPFKAVETLLNRSRAAEFSQQLAGGLDTITKIAAEPAAMKFSLGQKDAAWTTERIKTVSSRQRVSLTRATRPSPSIKRAAQPCKSDLEAIVLAAGHLFERNSVVRDYEIVAEAADNWRLKKTTVPGLWAALAELPLHQKMRDGWCYVTTPEVIAEENRLIGLCLHGKGKFEPINEFWKWRDEELTAEQKQAGSLVLNSPDFVIGIAGVPGGGKSRLMRELITAIEAGCYKVHVLAAWGVTAHDTLKDDGIAANTIKSLLVSPKFQREARGSVLIVDEAALVSTRLGDEFFQLADKLGCRIVLVGDTAQHLPVDRGQLYGGGFRGCREHPQLPCLERLGQTLSGHCSSCL